MPHLIVFSHLRWAFVFQRPQHLLSRLARRYSVVFVEEPVHTEGPSRLERSTPVAGVDVLRPHTAVEAGGFHDEQLSALGPLIAGYLVDEAITDYVVWFYTPMALPLLDDLAPRAVVYDCMDELSAFKNAPRQLRQREAALLKRADFVTTGGPRLFEAKRQSNPNVLCLPSAVDAAHYAPSRAQLDQSAVLAAEVLQGHISAPRLGFFGVIDERLDLDLVASVADADPAWHVVMVGPIVKIDPATLPQRPNVHWLGQQAYEILPQLVAGWDVCLMPFARNESTEFISPTKTLEYMAAGKPVVSAPIHDVQAMFGDLVAIAATPELFVSACRTALTEQEAETVARQEAMRARVASYSWDSAADTILGALDRVLAPPRGVDETDEASSPRGPLTAGGPLGWRQVASVG